MNYHVYFPQDLLKAPINDVLVGLRFNHVFICVMWVPVESQDHVLGCIEGLEVIGSKDGSGYFKITAHSKHPLPIFQTIDQDRKFTIILFNPPDYRNLEYFTINPIFLQSMGHDIIEVPELLQNTYDKSFPLPQFSSSIADETILDKINSVLKLRTIITAKLVETGFVSNRMSLQTPQLLKFLTAKVFKIFAHIVLSIQMLTVTFINIINFEFLGISLVGISQVFRQLDLRLKQITHFPIQFLCYYDKSILYKDNSVLLEELGLPLFNSNLNINNSNYINLYNSLWLIFNDILIGVTVWNLISMQGSNLFTIVYERVFQGLLIDGLFDVIGWISYRHPAGFKLNNELGKFMGDLFLWSLKTWERLVSTIITDENIDILMIIIKVLCFMGVTFLIAMIIDLINIITIHVFWFYQTSARIYQRQIEVIKSLFQLFRGKKYNVLRNRVDNINNYSKPNEFEIDHLLLGTVFFMILILLLPTTFGFYLLFFLLKLGILLSQNLCENLLIVINFLPIFVILLKLKNSNRLQGGVTFELQQYKVQKITYLKLYNKSLTYSEIFVNFTHLFKRSKNFRTSLLSSFYKGQLISLNRNYNLKFNYLMLPENYEKSIDIWRYFTYDSPERRPERSEGEESSPERRES